MIGKIKNTLKHLFLPLESNNHRAKLLHHKILFLVTLVLLTSSFVMPQIKTFSPQILGITHNVTLDELLLLTNQKRIENNLPPLVLSPELSLAASNKADDMFVKDYWAHNSPDGKTPWKFIRDSGYNYIYAGENLARGFTSGGDVVNAWMDSPTHRLNVLSPNYEDIGFSVMTGKLGGEETVLVVQEFGGRREFLAKKPLSASESSESVREIPTESPVELPQEVIKQKPL
ncbi:MAG: CAP domain-containing protein, partial [Patescibacteria group bacterium]